MRGATQDTKTGEWGTLLSLKDRSGEWKDIVIHQEELFGEGEKWVKKLTAAGLIVYGTTVNLKNFVHQVGSSRKFKSVSQIGWLDGDKPTFIYPKGNNRDVRFSGDVASYKLASMGTLEQWKNEVAKHAEENSRVGLAICVSLAAPLLKRKRESGTTAFSAFPD